jgi:hypothetical protein
VKYKNFYCLTVSLPYNICSPLSFVTYLAVLYIFIININEKTQPLPSPASNATSLFCCQMLLRMIQAICYYSCRGQQNVATFGNIHSAACVFLFRPVMLLIVRIQCYSANYRTHCSLATLRWSTIPVLARKLVLLLIFFVI